MEQEQPLSPEQHSHHGSGRGLLVIALVCVGVLALGIWFKAHQQAEAFEAERAQMKATLDQTVSQSRGQIQDLTQRLDALQAAQQAPPEPAKPTPFAQPNGAAAHRRAATRTAANDPRVARLQGQLAETQQQLAQTRQDMAKTKEELNGSIASTRDDLAKTRNDLSGQIDSTRTDLNGSIARTHDEVVALQKRGEQNIVEFHLDKSKQYQRVGPFSLALRSTNTKHKTYDLSMVVEDNQLNKKHVNLYEPVWITLSDRPQPVELVVNRIDKNQISGYITEPKYKNSELGTATAQKAPAQPAQLATR